jgi:hypothetical protein
VGLSDEQVLLLLRFVESVCSMVVEDYYKELSHSKERIK